MTAPRFFLPSVDEDRLTITGEDARHALRALRIHPGETITISDGAGHVATAKVVEAGNTMVADVADRTVVAGPRPRITVYQSIPKHGRLEEIADALTQLGVEEIVPVVTQRSIPRWDERKAVKKLDRLRAIVREAAMQSRRAWLPRVGDVGGIGSIPGDAIVLHEEAAGRLSEALPKEAPDHVSLAVGPEGGFDPEEIAVLATRGCRVAGLGPLVLRTELAAPVAAAVIAARYGVLG